MKLARTRWVCATVAPWVIAAGVLVSFTAVASNDPKAGISGSPAYRPSAYLRSSDLPPSHLPSAYLRSSDPPEGAPDAALVAGSGRFASAGLGPVSRGEAPRGEAPRDDAKPGGGGSQPTVRRERKGPLALSRASFSRRGLEIAASRLDVARHLAFARDTRVLPPTVLMPGSVDGPDWEASRGLEPWAGEDPTKTGSSSSVQSPAAAAAGSTGAARGPSRISGQGTTPATGRAVALSSTTPAPADAVPLQVAAAPVSAPRLAGLPGLSSLPTLPAPGRRPSYADLFAGSDAEREQRCLAEVVYFEARSEPEEGRAAVAQVVLNRARSGLYPSSVCGVVYQNRNRHLACQFTFACEGKALRITEPDAWDAAKRIARDVSEGRTYLADVGGSTHYHADYVTPYWARRLKRMDVIGRHIFYQLKPGQT